MANISSQLADLAIVRSLLLQRVANGLSNKVSSVYQDIIDDIDLTIRSADNINLRNMRSAIKELQSRIDVDINFLYKDLDGLAVSEATYAFNSTNAVVGVDVFSKFPPESVIDNITKSTLMEGATIGQYYRSLNDSMKFDLDRTLKMGVTIGETNEELAKRVSDKLLVSKRHAMTIARTGANAVASQARQATYEANSDVIGGWQYNSTLDSRVSNFCKAYSGLEWDADKKPIGHKNPYRLPPSQTHWNCVTGDTLISTRYPISYISRRAYKGVLYRIKTASGNVISCTPNHPILTNRGFITASSINKVDKIATDLVGKGLRGFDKQDSEGVSTIENLFTTFSEDFGVSPITMPTTPEDFHGDVTDDKVDIILIDRKLWLERNPSFSKETSNVLFILANSFASSLSNLNKRFVFNRNAHSSSMTRFNLFGSLFFSHKRPLHSFLFRLVSKFNSLSFKLFSKSLNRDIKSFSNASNADTVLVQSNSTLEDKDTVMPLRKVQGDSSALDDNSLDDFVSDTELGRNILNGTLGDKVFLDDIVEISIAENVLTHVYNLENDLNYYTANNLISHNCRSVMLPTLKSWEEMGIDLEEIPQGTQASLDGQVSGDLSFGQWLKTKDETFVEETLGKGRAELFLDGKITMSDLINQQGRELTIAELKALDKTANVAKVSSIDKLKDKGIEIYGGDTPEFEKISDTVSDLIDEGYKSRIKTLGFYNVKEMTQKFGAPANGVFMPNTNTLGISPLASIKSEKFIEGETRVGRYFIKKNNYSKDVGELKFVSTHEFFHSMVSIDEKKKRGLTPFDKKARELFDKYKEDMQTNMAIFAKDGDYERYKDFIMTKGIGSYGESSVNEFFAEAFAGYKTKAKKSKYELLVGELVDEYFKDK